jgi:hypothetical protein
MKKPDNKMKYGLIAPSIILLIGFLLMVMMIALEDEPGALPLFMILTGGGWFIFNRSKRTSASVSSKNDLLKHHQ